MGSLGQETAEPAIDHDRLLGACDLRAAAGVAARTPSRQSFASVGAPQPDLQAGLVDVFQTLLSEIRAERTELVELLGRTASRADAVFKACLCPFADEGLRATPPPRFTVNAAFDLDSPAGDGAVEQPAKRESWLPDNVQAPTAPPLLEMRKTESADSTLDNVDVDFEEMRAAIAEEVDDVEEKVRQAEILKLLSFLPDCWLIRGLSQFVMWFYNLEEPTRAGCVARFVLHSRFDLSCVCVIMINVLFAAYQADWEISNLGENATQLILLVELFFLLFYLAELILKLSVHRVYFFVNDDWKWNIFDFFLVLAGTYDQAALHIFPELNKGSNLTFMRMFRLLKLSKVMRVFRVIHFLHELRLMLLSMYKSLVSLFWCVVLLSFILYVFSLFVVMGITSALTVERDNISVMRFDDIMEKFGSISRTIISLFKAATGGADWGEYYEAIEIAGPQYSLLFLFYIAFFTFAVMNILTGMIVDNVVKESRADDDDRLLQYRRDQAEVLLEATRVFEGLDENGDGMVGTTEFMKGMQSDELLAMLLAIDIEVNDIEWFFKMLLYIEGSDRINIRNFMDACQKMKGHATSVDVQYLAFETKCIRKSLSSLSERLRVRGI